MTDYDSNLQRFEIQVPPGPKRDAIIAQYMQMIHRIGLALPTDAMTGEDSVGPCQLLNFGGFYPMHELFETWIAQEDVAGYGGKLLALREGKTCPEHYHRKKTETFFVVSGCIRLWVRPENNLGNPTEIVLEPGMTYTLRPGMVHSITAVGGPAIFLEFATQCFPEDNIFTDTRIGNNGII
ncbi:MAG: cupin domain-containing protein [Candidatus Berkelbacteria bacterium]|nr:cupin domain-containing protein [Candidatus Berkelbacteria bacterium]